jgi:hypothetical protein
MMIRRPMLLLTVLCTSAMASMAVAAEPNDGLEDTLRIPAKADTGSGDGGQHRSVATQAG